MRRSAIDLDALRSAATRMQPRDAASWFERTVTRGQALGMAGATGLGAAPLSRLLLNTALDDLEVIEGPGRVALRSGGRDLWVVDVRWFGGTAVLRSTRTSDRITIALRGARYAGTPIPADFQCELRRSAGVWRIQIALAFGDFKADAALQPWLEGRHALSAPVQVAYAFALDSGAQLTVHAHGTAVFTPQWEVRLTGLNVVSLDGVGAGTLRADTLVVQPLPAEAPSLLSGPAARRTMLTMQRGEHLWHIAPKLRMPSGARLLHGPRSFETLSLECGEARSGVVRYALSLTSPLGEDLAYQPDQALRGPDGDPFTLALHRASYVLVPAQHGKQEAFLALLGDTPARLVFGGHTLEVAGSEDTATLELTSAAPARLSPAVRAVHLSMRGAVIEPLIPPVEARLALPGHLGMENAASVWATVQPAAQQLEISNPTFNLVRPGDMLVLTFDCQGFVLRVNGDGTAALAPASGAANAALVVRFPPQHIHERAYFRRVSNYKVPPGDADASAGQETPVRPAPAYLAQESRLVFGLPEGIATLPFTLESLLDWQQLVPLLATTARAPVHHRVIRIPVTKLAAPLLTKGTLPLAAPEAHQDATLPPSTTGPYVHPAPYEPGPRETAIEAPFRLLLSPVPSGTWLHAFAPVTDHGRTELWHTRLGVKLPSASPSSPAPVADLHYVYQPQGDGQDRRYVVTGELLTQGRPTDAYGEDADVADRAVRAIWSRDYATGAKNAQSSPAYRASLTTRDRYQIVRLSADFSHEASARQPYQPPAIAAKRLMLSGLGAWLDLRGSFNPSALGLSLEEWIHRGAMGRDSYVRVVYRGYLYPFGHRASLVKVTERKFVVESGKNVAYLLQRMFIVVREPVKLLRTSGLTDAQGNHIDRQMPFSIVRSTTITTPDLDIPQGLLSDQPAESAFVPRVANKDFLFHLVGVDVTGATVEFTAPLAFVSTDNDLAYNAAAMDGLRATLEGMPGRLTYQMAGQNIAYAESASPGDTTLHTLDATFTSFKPASSVLGLKNQDQPAFYPLLAHAAVKIPALEALLRSGQVPQVKISPFYMQHGFGGPANIGEIFLETVDPAATSVSFGGSGSGPQGSLGVITPTYSIGGISRSQGPIGGNLAQIADGSMNLPDNKFYNSFFDPSKAKILGGLSLGDVADTPVNPSDLPQLLEGNDHEDPKNIDSDLQHKTYKLSWNPKVKQFGPYNPDVNSPDPKNNGALSVTASTEIDYTGKPGNYKVEGKLTNFALDLFEVITAHFDEFTFAYSTEDKMKVKPKGVKVTFGGPLTFVNDLKKYIPGGGDSGDSGGAASSGSVSAAMVSGAAAAAGTPDLGGPFVDPSVDHVDAGVRLHLPSISIGLFALTNIKFAMVFTVPYFGDPVTTSVTFASRKEPCHLQLGIFTGGLFFGITMGLDGVHSLEAAIEFGAGASLDLGIASGSVYAMAGIYFKFTPGTPPTSTSKGTPDVALLTGFFRAGGSVEVLGIVSVSIELYLGLTYEDKGGHGVAYGQATLTLEVSLLFFSKSFSVSVEREIAGSDPRFIDQISHSDWDEYLAAFATA